MKITINTDKLDKFSRRVSELSQGTNVPLTELFPASFMQKHTKFASIDDLVASSGFSAEQIMDLGADAEKWESYIQRNTDFPSWESMLAAGGAEWMASQLDLK